MEFRQDQAIYLQIAELVSENILAGVWRPEDRIPSTRELAESIEVNPNTVVRTYAYLQEKGIIVNQRGIGYFVADDAVEVTTALRKADFVSKELPRIFHTMELLGMAYGEIEELYAAHRARHSKETRKEAQA
jgi:DNA-binding transcriptional regulator YhcF (GntR family)